MFGAPAPKASVTRTAAAHPAGSEVPHVADTIQHWHGVSHDEQHAARTGKRLRADDVSEQQLTSLSAGPLPKGWDAVLGVQFQMDANANGGQMQEYLDQVNLTVW